MKHKIIQLIDWIGIILIITTIPILIMTQAEAKEIPQITIHEVSDNYQSSSYNINTTNFRQLLDYLYKERYVTLTFNEYYWMRNNPEYQPEKAIILVFDDGTITQYNQAYKEMRRYGYKGVIGTITDKVGTRGYMNEKQLLELRNNGWEIASHSKTHTSNSYQEYKESKEWITNLLGYEPTTYIHAYNEINNMRYCLTLYTGCTGKSYYLTSKYYQFMKYDEKMDSYGLIRMSTNDINKHGIQTLIQKIEEGGI